MAFAVLTAEARRLRGAGLRYLLLPEAGPQSPAAALPFAAPESAPRGGQAPRRPGPEPPRQEFRRPPGRPAGPVAGGPGGPGRSAGTGGGPAGARPQGAPSGQGPAQAEIRKPAESPQAAQAPQITGPEDWPQAWRELFQRTRPGPVAWTYFGLGYDLCGQASTQRRERLTALIRCLRLPAGTHTFWPVGLPDRDEDGNAILRPDPGIFWSGLRLLGARFLIAMGSPAARAIGVRFAIRPMFAPAQAFNGVRLLITWDIDLLDDEDRLSSTGTFLQTTLRGLF